MQKFPCQGARLIGLAPSSNKICAYARVRGEYSKEDIWQRHLLAENASVRKSEENLESKSWIPSRVVSAKYAPNEELTSI